MNFYPHHIGDYAKHTRHLGLMGDLAYRRMIEHYYTIEGPLPLEPEKIARLIGMRDQIKDVCEILSDFFLKSENGWVNKRCEEEIEAYLKKANRARAANKARWNIKSDPTSDVKPYLISDTDQIPTNPNPNPNPKKEKNAVLDKPKRQTFSLNGFQKSFDQFWQSYPKKTGKGAVEKIWNRLKPNEDLVRAMIEQLDRQKRSASWTKNGGEFIPNPSTWLNEKRWTDEPMEVPVKKLQVAL